MTIHLIKDPDNEHDNEAIRAEMDGLGKIGYVANSPHTIVGESYSAGRLYDKIDDIVTWGVTSDRLFLANRGIAARKNPRQ